MRKIKPGTFEMITVFLAGLVSAGPVYSETMSEEISKGNDVRIVISSKALEVDNVKKIITFGGGVNAVRGDFVIDCEKMVVFYEELSNPADKEGEKARVEKIVATGNVKVSRAKGGVATAEQGVYYEKEDKVVLTGNPVVKRGDDFVQGDRITIFLNEDRSLVESTGDKRVKAIIFPNKGENKK